MVHLLTVACLACESTDGAPPVGGFADVQNDRATIDVAPDRTLDASVDVSADVTSAETGIVDLDASRTNDRSSDDADRSVDGDGSDGGDADGGLTDQSIDVDESDSANDDAGSDSKDVATEDASSADQDAPDGDGRPVSHPTCTVDQPCTNGDCIGTSCDQAWTCFPGFAPHPCPLEIIPYCGCDGKTYYFPILCSEVPYLHAGECGDGVNCDRNDIRCAQPEPDCGLGQAASVVNGCYGPCVAINSCRCVLEQECPGSGLYMCNPLQRCDFYPEAGTSASR